MKLFKFHLKFFLIEYFLKSASLSHNWCLAQGACNEGGGEGRVEIGKRREQEENMRGERRRRENRVGGKDMPVFGKVLL